MIYRTIPSVDIIASESQKVVTEVATFFVVYQLFKTHFIDF